MPKSRSNAIVLPSVVIDGHSTRPSVKRRERAVARRRPTPAASRCSRRRRDRRRRRATCRRALHIGHSCRASRAVSSVYAYAPSVAARRRSTQPQLGLIEVAAALAPPLVGRDAARDEREPLAVGRRRRAELVDVAIVGHRHRRAAVARHAKDVVHAGDVVARRAEVDPPAVARPAVELLEPVVQRQPADARRSRASARRCRRRRCASRRTRARVPSGENSGRRSFAGSAHEQARVAAGGRHRPDVAARRERDLAAVGRDARLGERVFGRRRSAESGRRTGRSPGGQRAAIRGEPPHVELRMRRTIAPDLEWSRMRWVAARSFVAWPTQVPERPWVADWLKEFAGDKRRSLGA